MVAGIRKGIAEFLCTP